MPKQNETDGGEFLAALWSDAIAKQYHDWANSPIRNFALEAMQREWAARPWYQKARIRAANRLREYRLAFAEIIAGRHFDDC